eukprot:CAMPEP_0118956584 /NCGR_PEP_ID=MMETSP1169-20130426/61653_1 /TAXON_ID=36882 /ORGANISM="Pyramimonas obovata, Strain CCMP722" /LENGTH=305 /DNA_ID=CAMNT_0006904621 /DNA_START=95 /DNA_END=1012 /DNA_ORIENTATION=+
MYSPQDAAQDGGQGGGKRQRGDDWICSACGNSNFGFRTSCNMRKCGAPKPSAGGPSLGGGGSQGGGYKAQLGGYQGGGSRLPSGGPSEGYGSGYGNYAGYGGYGGGMDSGLGTMNMGMGMGGMGYGMEANMAPMPALGGMGMGGMGMGAMGGYGGGMGGYGGGMGGYGGAMPQAYGGGYGGGMPNPRGDSDSRKRRGGPDDREAGDWYCMACGNMNFAFRTTCNMRKCGAPKPEVPQGGLRGAIKSRPRGGDDVPKGEPEQAPDGSWTCKCGNVNYPFRNKCNRRNCGLDREPAAQDAPPQEENA